jgi:ribonuclease G
MSKELVIGSNRHETKVAVLEDDQLVELYFQRANEYSLAGSIHKGRVTRVLPGMQSAFVDLGLERDTFLYVSDFFDELNGDEIDTVSDEKPLRGSGRDAEGNLERGREESSRGDRFREDNRNRDDRYRRDRGGRPPVERAPVERTALTSAAPEPFVALPPALAGELAEEEIDEHEPEDISETLIAPVTLAGEVRAADSQPRPSAGGSAATGSNDRNRGGNDDRSGGRNRRSRRRRGRGGRGIPENKYAQPGSASDATPTQTPVSEVETEIVAQSPMPVSDVIILPGESLAKYRTRPDVTPARSFAPEIPPEPVPEDAAEEAIDAGDDLDDEIESLELTDKVFGHQENEGPELEEETKIAEVRHDHPAPEAFHSSSLPASVPPVTPVAPATESHRSELQAGSSPGPIDVAPLPAAHVKAELPHEEVRQERLSDISWSPERRAAEELFSKVVPIRDDEELDLPVAHHLSAAEEFEADIDELDATGSIASVHALSPEVEEALEAGEFESVGPETAESGESPAGQTTQSASLREQGGRYPHRSSRRMRRRRGGSRFGAEGPSNAPAPAAGAAPALQSDARGEAREPREPREHREPRESRSSDSFEERVSERPERMDRVMPSISDLLKPGQEIIVQIAKEPLGQKGARITSHIALPGRYVVFMPSVNHVGVSRKVSSEEERQRLKRILQAHRVGTTGGFIVRTAGEGVPEDEIAADMNFLYTLWLDIRQKAEKKPAPVLLHYDLDVVQRILRDQITEDFKAIWVDNEDLYENVLTFMQRFQPALVNRVKMYTRSAPIFDAFNITQELEKALRPKVWLKSGGYLVINQTEALVAIDINTGKYVGRSNRLEDTIVKTNTEAVKEIVRQIRLRDLGGIIVVDFIDMDERKNRQKVMQALEEAMRADKAPYKILQFNDFGLVAITRKRVKQSLERTLCAPCHYCEGAGYVKSTQTVIGEILIEAQKISKAIEGKDVLLRVHPEVAKVLKASDNKYLEELEEILGRPVLVKGDATLHSEKFDLG